VLRLVRRLASLDHMVDHLFSHRLIEETLHNRLPGEISLDPGPDRRGKLGAGDTGPRREEDPVHNHHRPYREKTQEGRERSVGGR
jgi:hypothetical protein